MATFRPVNTSLAPDAYARNGEETTPTTPRPSTAPGAQPHPVPRMDDATTPTRANFGALPGQRPLPAQPFPATIAVPDPQPDNKQALHRGGSQYSAKSRDSEDQDMAESDDGEDGSDDESVNADGTRSKKKKSQRFYCVEYPPCNLSFTRSEHLARHIRKHTGERPFQCHCSRRFSRLDNLRQHAQTVHVNEEIPTDSLAATGTRFQRQVRTDRVRPPGSRSRAATAGSQQGPVRGHHRNSLSASSISSVGSAFSAREDARRRPPPLQMAGQGGRLSGEIMYRPDSPNQYQYRGHSPGGFSTPTSATFSNGQSSPRWGSGMPSPISSHSRTASIYNGHRTPGRRLSVPSAGNPFQSPHGGAYGPPTLGNMNSSNAGAFSPSSSMLNSPTTSTSGWSGRRESVSSAADDPWRRRTWHPDATYNYSSRLQNVTTNYYSSGPPPQVPVVPSNAPPLQHQNSITLPGIASFDQMARPTTPVRRQPSPMMIDTPSRAPMHQPEYREERPSSQHWDQGINRNLNRLDIAQGTPPTDTAGAWASETNRAVLAQAEPPRAQQAVRFEESPYSARTHAPNHHYSAPPVTPREAKRQAWYHGPVVDPRIQRTSPADSSGSEAGVPGTPSSATVGDFNPSIVHSNGYVEGRSGVFIQHPPVVPSSTPGGYSTYQPQPMNGVENSYSYATNPQGQSHLQNGRQGHVSNNADNNMSKLEALVAVATSEENVAAAY